MLGRIVAAAILVLLTAGAGLLYYVCVRWRERDLWSPEELDKRRDPRLREAVLAGREWLEAQIMEHVTAVSDDELVLHGIFVPRSRARGTVIFFHGYRSSWKLDFASVARFFHERGFQLLFVDERAHGESDGRYITYGVTERFDVRTWVGYVSGRFGAEHPIFLDGLSMGATTVLMASSLELPGNVRGIIADCGFTSPHEIIGSVARKRMHLPAAPVLALLNAFTNLFASFGLKDYSTLTAVAETEYPILFIHGTADGFVPCEMTRLAYDACTSDKRLVLVEGAAHGMSYLVDKPRVEAAVESFLEKNLNR